MPANRRCVAREIPPPRRVTKHRHRCRADSIVLRTQSSAQDWLRAKHLKEISGHQCEPELGHLVGFAERRGPRTLVGIEGNLLQRAALGSELAGLREIEGVLELPVRSLGFEDDET